MNADTELLDLLQQLRFYITPSHQCSYLPRDDAVTLFADPHARMNTRHYSLLVSLGFRRSGSHIYRPHCPTCDACVPVRIDVHRFHPKRNQIRTLKRNNDLRTLWRPAQVDDEHFALYKRYLLRRHHGSSMTTDDPQQYERMMLTEWGDTRLLEIRHQQQLLAVAMTDWLTEGLSAVYTFFDPDLPSRSLGTYSILQQIEAARNADLPYVYLGYWIEPCQNMAYKKSFNALQCFNGQQWLPLDDFIQSLK